MLEKSFSSQIILEVEFYWPAVDDLLDDKRLIATSEKVS